MSKLKLLKFGWNISIDGHPFFWSDTNDSHHYRKRLIWTVWTCLHIYLSYRNIGKNVLKLLLRNFLILALESCYIFSGGRHLKFLIHISYVVTDNLIILCVQLRFNQKFLVSWKKCFLNKKIKFDSHHYRKRLIWTVWTCLHIYLSYRNIGKNVLKLLLRNDWSKTVNKWSHDNRKYIY
jgi:hypothetical protein